MYNNIRLKIVFWAGVSKMISDSHLSHVHYKRSILYILQMTPGMEEFELNQGTHNRSYWY